MKCGKFTKVICILCFSTCCVSFEKIRAMESRLPVGETGIGDGIVCMKHGGAWKWLKSTKVSGKAVKTKFDTLAANPDFTVRRALRNMKIRGKVLEEAIEILRKINSNENHELHVLKDVNIIDLLRFPLFQDQLFKDEIRKFQELTLGWAKNLKLQREARELVYNKEGEKNTYKKVTFETFRDEKGVSWVANLNGYGGNWWLDENLGTPKELAARIIGSWVWVTSKEDQRKEQFGVPLFEGIENYWSNDDLPELKK